ncbi:MAG: DUF1080 domain-containing protein [Rikenellaceae bacterium]
MSKVSKKGGLVLCVVLALAIILVIVKSTPKEESCCEAVAANTLTAEEVEAGWELLFDGESLAEHWSSAKDPNVDATTWAIEDGVAAIQTIVDGEVVKGGHINTKKKYSAFEFSVDFKLTEAANSGIKYFFYVGQVDGKNRAYGLEYQLLDDVKHPDAVKYTVTPGSRTLCSLYDMKAANEDKPFNGIGEWNTAYIKALPDGKVEHYLNGVLVLEYVRFSDEFYQLLEDSKYTKEAYYTDGEYPFGCAPEGYIQLQDHNDQVYFRNMKVRDLSK